MMFFLIVVVLFFVGFFAFGKWIIISQNNDYDEQWNSTFNVIQRFFNALQNK
jgi:hypothetical protein